MTFLATVTTFRIVARYRPDELQGGQDLNLQPAVLETAALPIEPPPYGAETPASAPPVRFETEKWAWKMMADFNRLIPV
jgi:hypothetical protein